MKTKLAIASILVLLTTLIVSLGVYRIYLEKKLAQAFDGSTVHVPAGEFIMGNDSGNPDERPQRRVYLDAFEIDKYEVTNVQYRRFIQATSREAPQSWPGRYVQFTDSKVSLDWQAGTYPVGQATYPVVMVNWEDADAYCTWAGKRLPTEAEWEKAARGTDGRTYPWGNTWDDSKANTKETGIGHPQPVGSYPAGASPYGVLDMAGNVWEWVADQYGRDYYSQAPDRNPQGPSVGWGNVQRGGSWYSPRQHVSTTFRNMTHCYAPNYRVGFRCARTLSPPTLTPELTATDGQTREPSLHSRLCGNANGWEVSISKD